MAPMRSKPRSSVSIPPTSTGQPDRGSLGKSTKTRSPASITPRSRSSKKNIQLTQAQKQALIDNLQLEITERARKLRSQYALQAQSLRTRLEIRVHRIPVSLRKTRIAELLEQHSGYPAQPNNQVIQLTVSPQAPRQYKLNPVRAAKSGPLATDENHRKRKSHGLDDDKENSSGDQTAAVKRRAPAAKNAAKPVATSTTRTASKRAPPSQVLSPKSNNAQRFPYSPYKPTMSPVKSAVPRPTSPLKPASTSQRNASQQKTAHAKSKAKPAASNASSKQTLNSRNPGTNLGADKRTAAVNASEASLDEAGIDGDNRRGSNISEAASTSTNTTIVRTSRKAAMPLSASTAATKGKVAGMASKFEGIGGNGKKIVASKPASKPTRVRTATGGRALRKRA